MLHRDSSGISSDSLIFDSRAKNPHLECDIIKCSTWVGSDLTSKYYTSLSELLRTNSAAILSVTTKEKSLITLAVG